MAKAWLSFVWFASTGERFLFVLVEEKMCVYIA